MITCLPLIALIMSANGGQSPAVLATNPSSMSISVGGVTLPVAPLEKIAVKDEEHMLGDDQPKLWFGGISPKMVLGPVDVGTRLPLVIDPASVVVKTKTGDIYTEGKDYILEHYWGGIGRNVDGRIKADETVLIDYSVSLQRVDLVQISPKGVISVKKGDPARVCPIVPEPDAGCERIASVFLPYNTSSIKEDQIYNIEDNKHTWKDYVKVQGSDYLANTRTLLNSDGEVTVVCYGDSVTQGASASSPELNYVGLLKTALDKAYPKSKHKVINAGIGGTNTDQRLPDMDKQVLSFNPDLVVIEFVNDMGFPREKLISNYSQLIDRVRATNPKAGVIILTPHFTRPDWMTTFHASCDTLREVARDKKVGLGDTAAVWGSLRKLGIPYQTLLANEINHPNDLGHSFFCETIMRLLTDRR